MFPMRTIVPLATMLAMSAHAAQLVTDERTRLTAITVLFPQMAVKLIPGKRIDSSRELKDELAPLSAPDALHDERVYLIDGAPTPSEECVAMDIPNPDKRSPGREIRFRVYRMSDDFLLVAMQYAFADIQPGYGCTSIARLALLRADFQVVQVIEFESARHYAIQRLDFVDLGRGGENLIIESDWGGGGAFESDLLVFELSGSALTRLFRF